MTNPLHTGPLATIYLSREEIDVIAIHLAIAVTKRVPYDAHVAARLIWEARPNGGVLCSLATMLSEARTGLERGPNPDDLTCPHGLHFGGVYCEECHP